MNTRDLFSLLSLVVVAAMLSTAVVNGKGSKDVIDSAASGFSNIIRAATLQNPNSNNPASTGA